MLNKEYCPNCKSTQPYRECGFENYNRRWLCLGCNEYIPERKSWVGLVIWSMLLVLALLVVNVSAAVTVSTDGENINVTGSGSISISTINTEVADTDYIENLGSNVYVLYKPLIIKDSGVELTISNADVTQLRINETAHLEVRGNNLIINNTRITGMVDENIDYNSSGRGSIFIQSANAYLGGTLFEYLGDSALSAPKDTSGVYLQFSNYPVIENNNFTTSRIGLDFGNAVVSGNITNNYFNNNSFAEFRIATNAGTTTDILIEDNEFRNVTRGIYEVEGSSYSNFITVNDNIFYQLSTPAMITLVGRNNHIFNNTIYGNELIFSYAMDIRSNDTIVEQNTMEKTQYSIYTKNAKNTTIRYNEISNSDIGSWLHDSSFIYFFNNTLKNLTLDYDAYDLGIKLSNSTNIYLWGNNWSEIASAGIFSQGSTNLSIRDNSISMIPFSERGVYSARDLLMPPCAIILSPIYKSYYGGGYAMSHEDTVINTSQHTNENVTILGNTFENSQCYLWNIGTETLEDDLTNFFFRSYQFHTTLINKTEIWMNSDYNNLSQYNNGLTDSLYYFRYNGLTYANVSLKESSILFENLNSSVRNLSLFNLTTGKATFDNGTWITLGDQANLTLSAGQWVEVQQDCVVPVTDLNVSTTTTLCSGTYQLNASSKGYVINVTGGNTLLDMGGAVIIGNGSTGLTGINVNGDVDRINITNGEIQGYGTSVYIRTSDNSKVENVTVGNSTYGIRFLTNAANGKVINSNIIDSLQYGIHYSNSDNGNISNNLFNNSNYLEMDGADATEGFIFTDSGVNGLTIHDNELYECDSSYFGLAGTSEIIDNNIIFGSDTTNNEVGLRLRASTNTVIRNNNISRFQYPIHTDGSTNGVNIHDNFIFNVDTGGRLGSASGRFHNNTIYNATLGFDNFNLGLKLINARNYYIEDNTFTDIATGIWLTNSSHIEVNRNTFTGLDINSRDNYFANDSNSAPVGMLITPLFHTWVTEGLDPGFLNKSMFTDYISTNVTIQENTLNNFELVMWTQNVTELVHDITANRVFRVDWWNEVNRSNTFYFDDDVQGYRSGRGLSSILQEGYRINYVINFSLSLDYDYYLNQNQTNDYHINRYNLTNALIILDNGSIIGSANLADNDGNINITLPPNNWSYVYDNYVLTEGRPLPNEPFGFSKTTNSEKRITNSLDITVNATVSVRVNGCNNAGIITYESDTLAYSQVFTKSDYTCSGNMATLDIIGIEPATSSNVLTIEYGCTGTLQNLYALILMVGAIGVLAISAGLFYQKGGLANLTPKQMVFIAVMILIGITLLVAAADSIASYCA